MKSDFNEFLRIMTCILIILLIIQGLDYIIGFGVNNHIFIIFCIVFAFTIGTIYHNILMERKEEELKQHEQEMNYHSCDVIEEGEDDDVNVEEKLGEE